MTQSTAQSSDTSSPQPHHTSQIRSLLSVNQFSEKHKAFSPASMRNIIFNAQDRHSSKGVVPGNGFAKSIIRLGRKILIDEEVFFECLHDQNGGLAE